MGMPGWPDLAFSTASMDSARMAFAMSSCATALSMLIFTATFAMPAPACWPSLSCALKH
jgi:hypothetical protein